MNNYNIDKDDVLMFIENNIDKFTFKELQWVDMLMWSELIERDIGHFNGQSSSDTL